MTNLLQRLTSFVIAAIGQYVDGMDCSKWQGLMQWDIAKAAGVIFAFIRAGSIDNISGACYTDDQFERNADLAPIYIKFTGFYWYFRPNWDPIKQAQYFANLIRDKTRNLPPAVDVEETGGLSPDKVRDALKAFIKELKIQLDIKFVLIYTRQTVWDSGVSPDPVFSMMPLWAARYKLTLTGPWSDGLYKFRDWLVWALWQWWADGNGQGAKYGAQSADICLDRFNGDMPAFEKWVNDYGKPIPEPSPDLSAIIARLDALEKETASQALRIDAVTTIANAADGLSRANKANVDALAKNLLAQSQDIARLRTDVDALISAGKIQDGQIAELALRMAAVEAKFENIKAVL